MSDASAPSNGSFTATLLASIGGLAIFLLILAVAYLPNKTAPAGDGVKTPEQRKALLVELQGKQSTAATTYAWVDKDAGVVRLPLDRAAELFLQENARR